jgi:hypothetical protein
MHGMLNHALRAPATLQLVGVSMEQAERLLAAIWFVLEARALASPTIRVRSAAGLIDISLTFGTAEDCSIVRACWQSARRRPRRFAHQMPKGTRVPGSATTNGAAPPPTEPEPAREVKPIMPGRIATSPRESCPLSMPSPDRASLGCRFITGDPKDLHALGEAIYCGSPVERIGDPWCAEHRRICYTRPRAGALSGAHKAA